MRRYAVPAAFLFCVAGLGASLYVGAGLAAFLFALAATCFAAKAWGDVRRRPFVPELDIMSNPSDWLARQFFVNMTSENDLVILPPGVTLPNMEVLRRARKAEAFRRYREYWAVVGQ